MKKLRTSAKISIILAVCLVVGAVGYWAATTYDFISKPIDSVMVRYISGKEDIPENAVTVLKIQDDEDMLHVLYRRKELAHSEDDEASLSMLSLKKSKLFSKLVVFNGSSSSTSDIDVNKQFDTKKNKASCLLYGDNTVFSTPEQCAQRYEIRCGEKTFKGEISGDYYMIPIIFDDFQTESIGVQVFDGTGKVIYYN